jgi:hypothetical protein
MVQDQTAAVVRSGTSAGLADERFKALGPAGCGSGVESGKAGIALAQRHSWLRPVQPQRGTQVSGTGGIEHGEGKIQVAGGTKGGLLAYDGEGWLRVLRHGAA